MLFVVPLWGILRSLVNSYRFTSSGREQERTLLCSFSDWEISDFDLVVWFVVFVVLFVCLFVCGFFLRGERVKYRIRKEKNSNLISSLVWVYWKTKDYFLHTLVPIVSVFLLLSFITPNPWLLYCIVKNFSLQDETTSEGYVVHFWFSSLALI